MVTPGVVELRSQHVRTRRPGPKNARVLRSAEYVPYRRRSATGAVRVATGLIGGDVPATPGGAGDRCVTQPSAG